MDVRSEAITPFANVVWVSHIRFPISESRAMAMSGSSTKYWLYYGDISRNLEMETWNVRKGTLIAQNYANDRLIYFRFKGKTYDFWVISIYALCGLPDGPNLLIFLQKNDIIVVAEE